ncbi:hypothetical protein ACGFXC_17700 [Streptomyces sp. NPDC048507]|uniref:hypothetical protein n=1 Tax=Streptomyces sp. NPDC048507 TaxID=3365560 RepID=UPI003714A0AD
MAISESETETPAEQQFSKPAGPEKLRDLEFLLGDFRVEWTNFTADPATTGVATWNTESTFGGHAYEMTQRVDEHDVNGRFIVQWVESESVFSGYYYDDWANRTLLTSEGWKDGFLSFTGTCVGFGKTFLLKEQYEVVDAGHYVKRGFVKFEEGDGADWIPADEIHAHRV